MKLAGILILTNCGRWLCIGQPRSPLWYAHVWPASKPIVQLNVKKRCRTRVEA